VTRIDITYELDMHYQGQTHTVAVPLPVTLGEDGTGISEIVTRAAFESAYAKAFSRLLPGIPVRIVNLRTAAIGRRPAFDLKALAPKADASIEAARRGKRPVWFDGGWHEATIWDRLNLPVGAIINGPAIFEQPDATTVIDPGLVAQVDDFGNLVVERAER
jgi:N-methylhydantoinase A